MKIEILDLAAADLVDGFNFYESQQAGLGEYFVSGLFSDIESLKIFAGIHRITHGNYHRLLAKRFPFAVYYVLNRGTVYVHAVTDCRRDPAWLRARLAQ